MTIQTLTLPTAHPVAVSLNNILDEVASMYLERRAVIEAVIMAVLSKQHAFILGPPGTGKSEMIREIINRFLGAKYYEALLSKTRPTEAVLGPYDLPELRDTGAFHRKIAGYLLDCDFAFLDEVGKMSPTLGHDLLAALNERVRHEVNGQHSVHPIPLRSCVTASNEMIVDESDDAAALWDRLLVRTHVDYIEESGNFALLLQSAVTNPVAATRTTIDLADLADVCDNVVPSIVVPVSTIDTVIQLRDNLRQDEIRVGDRRWRQCVRLLQASAFFAGRSQVEDDDLHVLRYALWDVPSQISKVERHTLSLSNPVAEAAMKLLDEVENIAKKIRDIKGQALDVRAAYGSEAMGDLKIVVADLAQKRQDCLAENRSVTKLDEVADRVNAVRRSVYLDCLDIDPSQIR